MDVFIHQKKKIKLLSKGNWKTSIIMFCYIARSLNLESGFRFRKTQSMNVEDVKDWHNLREK